MQTSISLKWKPNLPHVHQEGFTCMLNVQLKICSVKRKRMVKITAAWNDVEVFCIKLLVKQKLVQNNTSTNNWAPSSESVSSSIPSWNILTAHAQPFREARDLGFCRKVPLDSLLVRASSGVSGETAWMRRLAWTFAVRIGHEYQIPLTRPN